MMLRTRRKTLNLPVQTHSVISVTMLAAGWRRELPHLPHYKHDDFCERTARAKNDDTYPRAWDFYKGMLIFDRPTKKNVKIEVHTFQRHVL